MVRSLCVCGLAPGLELRTRVAVIMHVGESVRSSNTGRLVPLALANSFVCLRGVRHQPTETGGMIPDGSRGLVLYPSPGSAELDGRAAALGGRPLTLIVLDGNWNQAAKMARREPVLKDLPRVKLPPGPPSSFRLRVQGDPARVCTFEAVSRALGVIEGAEVQARLEEFLTAMVERMLWSRGRLKASQVAGGVPPEALSGKSRTIAAGDPS